MQRNKIILTGSFFSDGTRESDEAQEKCLAQHREKTKEIIANNPNSDIHVQTVARVSAVKVSFTAGMSPAEVKEQLEKLKQSKNVSEKVEEPLQDNDSDNLSCSLK